jgi:hypothetical protein
MPPKIELHILVSSKKDIYGFTLGTYNQSIRLRDDTQCPITLFISCIGELQYNLVCIVILCQDYSENDASWFFYIGLNDILHELNIGSRLLLRFRMDESR